jgi:plasmid rolling circle replication initiator protein Rep
MKHTHACVAPQHVDSPYLSDISPKDACFDKFRAGTDIVANRYAEAGMYRYADRAEGCSLWLQFRRRESGKLKLDGARFCKMKYCPFCQNRKSRMWRKRLIDALPDIVAENPTARYLILTLTVKNPVMDELKPTLATMNKAWQRLIQRKGWPGLGFIRATEITMGKDGNPHPHFHVLLQVRSSYFGKYYIKQAEWQRLWREALRADYNPVVDIRVVKENEKHGPDPFGMIAGICEVLKYSTKAEEKDITAEFLAGLTRQTFKLRFVATGGTLKQVLGKIEPESDDDLIHTGDGDEDDPLTDDPALTVIWERPEKRYKKGTPHKVKTRQSNP